MKLSWLERVALVAFTPLVALFLFSGVATTLRLVSMVVMAMESCREILCSLLGR